MNKFIRYYNQNHREIIIVTIIIIFIIVLLQVINKEIAKKSASMQEQKIVENVAQTYSSNNVGSVNTYFVATDSVEYVSNSKKDVEVISEFIECCNENKINEAYNLLSDNCKNEIFPSLEYFTENYYNNNFKVKKIYDIQAWNNSTYKIDFQNDILSTGNVNTDTIQDFITVVQQNDELKLNVNSYIGKTKLNEESEIRNVDIKIISKDTYMNYEIYTFEINNNNSFDIYLDTLEDTNSMFLTDSNSVKYVAYSHELSKEQVKINGNSIRKIRIKFTNGYIANRKLKNITFSNVKLCNETDEIIKISINLE